MKPICALASVALTLPALALPPGFVQEDVGTGWNQAVGIGFAPAHKGGKTEGRVFVWEKGGRVWNVENGQRNPLPLIDISQEVGDWRDFGLLGFAVDPAFEHNGYIYLLYVVDYHHARYYGTEQYVPTGNQYFRDTIGRLTRYTCNAADGYRSVDYGSRTVLIGESLTTGFPICHQSHGVGSLVFGEDGSLLASCGDGASYETVDNGGPQSGSSNTALNEGIIRPKEDVGANRSQLVDCLNGKIIRIDPQSGDGLPGNPYFDAGAPRAARSRVWAMGLRNPFRFCIKPGTGDPDENNPFPGVLYIGDVGWNSWEDIHTCTGPGQNFGWPIYEGLTPGNAGYFNANIANLDAPNPLLGQGGCTQPYFYFRQLIVQDTLGTPYFPNPCNGSEQIPASIPHFVHRRPGIDYGHGTVSRCAAWNGPNPIEINIGVPNAPVQGPQFQGNSSTGGAWYLGQEFPPDYQNSYFHGEYGQGWIRSIRYDAEHRPTLVRDFENAAGYLVCIASSPLDDAIYTVAFDNSGNSLVRRISYAGGQNRAPVAVASADVTYGAAPFTVNFRGDESTDPDGDKPLTYRWNFGDGSPASTVANPTHEYLATGDMTDEGAIIARIFQFFPPNPTGEGSRDPETIRDADYPPLGNQESLRQFDTYHGGDQGSDDWIGYTFPTARQISGVVFQEGRHFQNGGWWDSVRVQTRVGTTWTDVSGLAITPPYAGNNGRSFDTYVMNFPAPINADGVRVRGNPGGSANFISVGELRVSGPAPAAGRCATARLKVSDPDGAASTATVVVALNNSPPQVQITSPVDGAFYSMLRDTTVPMAAIVSDGQTPNSQLVCKWQTFLHHNEHAHPEPPVYDCEAEAFVSPIGCDGQTYFYEFRLTVSDPACLSTTRSVFLFPQCCLADYDLDGFVTGLDFDIYVGDFENARPGADFDRDGFVTGTDFDRFVQAYELGC